METTGMLMLGKMSVGVLRMITGAAMRMRIAKTMKVYGRVRATFTIHISLTRLERKWSYAPILRIDRPSHSLVSQLFPGGLNGKTDRLDEWSFDTCGTSVLWPTMGLSARPAGSCMC